MWVCRTQYIWDPSDSKILFAELLCDMLVMEGGAPANVAGGASIHADETAQKPLAHLGFKQGEPAPSWCGHTHLVASARGGWVQ